MGRVGKIVVGIAAGLVVLGAVLYAVFYPQHPAPARPAAPPVAASIPPPPLIIQGEQSYYKEIPDIANGEDPHAISAALDDFAKDNPGVHVVSMTIGRKGIYIFWICTRCR